MKCKTAPSRRSRTKNGSESTSKTYQGLAVQRAPRPWWATSTSPMSCCSREFEETVLAYLDLHEEALILTIDQAMMRSSSCLIISLWTERAIRQAWPSSEHTTTSSTWTSAAFLQLRHEQLKSGQASEDRKYRWAQFRSITDGRDGPQADRLGEHQEPDGGRGFWWLTDVREHCQPDRASSSADALVRSSFAQRSQQIMRFCACPRGCTTLVHGAIRYCDYCFVEAGEPQPIP